MCGNCGCDDYISEYMPDDEVGRLEKRINVEQDILNKNNHVARHNRDYFEKHHIYTINIVSSPGAGKTSILEETLNYIKGIYSVYVIEGDLHTDNDARRIKKTGVECLQINTNNSCHLNAEMVSKSILKMNIAGNSILFIENVGNLVCPALFDLGEELRVVVLSVTEGDDKPLKYPYIFEHADVCIINKIDLIPYLKSSITDIKKNIYSINPNILVFEVSAVTGSGINSWCEYLLNQVVSVEI